jgi:hypothetical protein
MNRATNLENASASKGLSLPEKEAFIRLAVSAMGEYTSGFICSVLGSPDGKIGQHLGSALRCKLNGRRAIVTALHVVEGAQKRSLGLALSTGYGERPYMVHGPVHIDPYADLAVYFLPDDYPCSDARFWTSARIDHSRDKLATDYLFLHGFPGKTSYSSPLLGGVISQSLPYGAMQRLENLPRNFQAFQFAVDYDPAGMVNETGAAPDLIDPHGLSGSPVWRIGVSGRASREWKPSDSLLVGILTQWQPDEKVLIATSTEKLPLNW